LQALDSGGREGALALLERFERSSHGDAAGRRSRHREPGARGVITGELGSGCGKPVERAARRAVPACAGPAGLQFLVNRAPRTTSRHAPKSPVELDLGREPRAELEVGRWTGFRYWLSLQNEGSFGVVGMPAARAPMTEMMLGTEVVRGVADPIVREEDGGTRRLIEERSVIQDVRVSSPDLEPGALAGLQAALDGLRGTTTKQLVAQNGEIAELQIELVGGKKPPPEIKAVLDEAFDVQRRFPFRLPPTPVGVGARWRFSEPMLIRGVRATQVAEMKLTALDARSARIGIRLRLQAGTQMIPHPLDPNRQATLESFRGDGDGELEIDRETAMVLSSRLATTAKLELSSIDDQQRRQVATFMASSLVRSRGGVGEVPDAGDGAPPTGYSSRIGAGGASQLALIRQSAADTAARRRRLVPLRVAISVALFGLGRRAGRILERAVDSEKTLEHAAISAVLAAAACWSSTSLLHVAPDWFALEPPAVHAADGRLLVVRAGGAAIFGGRIHDRARPVALRTHVHDFFGIWSAPVSAAPVCQLALGARSRSWCPRNPRSGAPFASGSVRLRWLGAAAVLLPALLGVTAESTHWLEIRVAKGVRLDQLRPELNRWNSFSMVTVLSQSAFRGWAPSPRSIGPIPEQKTLVIDMNAMTPLIRFSGSLAEVTQLSFDLSAFVYRVRPAPERVCVLGAGGGRDVLSALQSGARRVTAVEINPLIVNDVMRGRYRDYTGGLYLRPTSAWLSRTADLSRRARALGRRARAQDTSAATAAGAYALTENSLYRGRFRGLPPPAPRGVLTWLVSLPDLRVGARLASVARAALERLGRDPSRSVAAVAAPWLGTPVR
jgi:hypothetical protein